MRIEFLNVWYGRTGEVLRDYLKEEARTVDMFCFQEADGAFLPMAEEILGKDFVKHEAHKTVSEKDIFDQATFVRRSVKSANWRTVLDAEPEVGIGLTSEITNGNGGLTIVNFHGVSRPVNKLDCERRLAQTRGLIENFGGCQMPVIIGGDFNVEKATESVGMFSGCGYRDLIAEYGIRTTRNRLVWEKYPLTPMYYSDYVFVNPRVKVKDFKVIENEVSDHLPLILEIEE